MEPSVSDNCFLIKSHFFRCRVLVLLRQKSLCKASGLSCKVRQTTFSYIQRTSIIYSLKVVEFYKCCFTEVSLCVKCIVRSQIYHHLDLFFYMHILSYLLNQKQSNEAAFDTGVHGIAASECETQFAEGTVLFHVNQSAGFGHASIKNFLKFMKNVTDAPELVLDPFLLTVLLSISTISIYEAQVLLYSSRVR